MTRAKRPALGDDPFASLTEEPAAARPVAPSRATRAPGLPKVKETYELPGDLVDRMKNAAVALSVPPHVLTVARIVRTALERELKRLEREHNGGAPFPARKSDPKPGRPIQ